MRYTTLPLALFLLSVAGHAGAQTAPAKPSAKATAPLTLSRALAILPPPVKGVLLAVGAGKVTLPVGTPPPPADASPTVLANTFGDITQDFGTVTAIAPASRAVLNPNPAPPDLTADLGSIDAIKMLAGSLDDAQWKQLTSEGGLGLRDLTDDTQKLLFHALFYHGELWVASKDPAQEKLPDEQRTDTRNLSAQIDGVRLRMGQSAQIYVHDKKGKVIDFSGPPADTTRFRTWRSKYVPPTAQNNVLLRAVVDNTLRPGGLPVSDAKFQQAVTLTGIKTVGDLVARIAAKTHTELYDDPHYATRTVTVIGAAQNAPAADVLAALALAVAGTYRQVGPAFVLTDDLEGVGTRRKRLQNWEDGTLHDNIKLGYQAGAIMLKRRAAQAHSLPTFGDTLAFTPGQFTAFFKGDSVNPTVASQDHNYPFAKLTPAQQGRVRQLADAYEDQQATKAADSSDTDPPQEPNPTGAVSLRPEYKVQFLIPTVHGPVDTSIGSWLTFLFLPSLSDLEAMEAQKAATTPQAAAPVDTRPPAPPLLPLLRSRARRAVLGHPTTPAAVDALVDAMQKIGLNEMWLDVFSEGKSRLTDKGTDILTEALTKTQGTGIAVYADLSLLPWGNTPSEETRDLNILGENSQQAAIADHARQGKSTQDFDAAGQSAAYVPPPMLVSPAAASVKKTLTDTVRSLASRPGLAGFVWEEAERGDDLGYTPPMRLAFLRAFQADPVDITLDDYPRGDVSLPTFDDKAVDETLRGHWDDARLGANAFLLTQMRSAIPASVDKPVLMQRSDQSPEWLVSWDDPRQLPPPLRTLFKGNDYPSDEDIRAVAAKQGRSTLLVVPVRDPANTDALARDLQAALPPPSPKGKAAWDGYVLDFGDNHATDSAEPLSDLVRALGKPKETPAPPAAAGPQRR